jgi:hypothetical protein
MPSWIFASFEKSRLWTWRVRFETLDGDCEASALEATARHSICEGKGGLQEFFAKHRRRATQHNHSKHDIQVSGWFSNGTRYVVAGLPDVTVVLSVLDVARASYKNTDASPQGRATASV